MTIPPVRTYVDTCVFGGAFDEEFATATSRFFALAQQGAFVLTVSAVVMLELTDAPTRVIELVTGMRERLVVLDATPESYALQQRYLAAGILTPRWEDDALHVAMATVAGCDVMVSWNFKHIVNFRKIHQYNQVNQVMGYRPIDIRTPEEVIDYDTQEDV